MNTYTYSATPRVKPLFRGVQVVWYVLGILETLLAFRFILKLLAANPNAGFTDFVYRLSYPFVAPFLSVFRTPTVSGATFEWTTLLAMLVYWFVAWAIVKLFVMGKPVSTFEASSKLDEHDF